VAGTVALGVALSQRLGGGAVAREWSLALDEPAGTQVVAAAASGDGLALTLRGGGAERVVVVDPRTGRVLGRISVTK
jgi:voltage-gated potassium channel Kch